MVKSRKLSLAVALCFVVLTVFSFGRVHAASEYVFDDAGLFSTGEEVQISARLEQVASKRKMDILVVTTDDAGGKSSMEYADDFYDYNGRGVGENADGLLLLIDMDNRMVWISTCGKAIDVFSDERIDDTIDEFYPYIKSGDYALAAMTFADTADRYLKQGAPPPVGIFELAIYSAVGVIVGLVVFASVKVRYKTADEADTFPFRQMSHLNVTERKDLFLGRNVTSRVIQSSSSGGSGGSGGSSTHTSSSGRTHGGGGRRF